MFLNFINHLTFTSSLLITFIFSLFLFSLIIFSWRFLNKKQIIKKYEATQRVHQGEIPRLGGLVIYFSFWFYLLINDEKSLANQVLFEILISIIPIFLLIVKEDLTYNTSIKIRLAAMFISCLIFFSICSINLSDIQLPIFHSALNSNYIFLVLFFSFCCVVNMNGNNLIDGVNGLLVMTNIFQLFALVYLTIISQDNSFKDLIFLFFLLQISFLIFNYPFGKIFMGDFGAYFNAFFLSSLIIEFISSHNSFSSMIAILVLFYPCYELLFSVIRKIKKNRNPFKPDSDHLHLRIFYILKRSNFSLKVSNSLVMPLLFIFWSSPFFLVISFYNSNMYIIFSIVFLIIIYNFIFNLLSRGNLNQ